MFPARSRYDLVAEFTTRFLCSSISKISLPAPMRERDSGCRAAKQPPEGTHIGRQKRQMRGYQIELKDHSPRAEIRVSEATQECSNALTGVRTP